MKVFVLVASGLQLGYLGGYGNAWVDTPALDQLAAEGVVFDHHFADGPDAEAARRAWRTGRYQLPPVDPEAAPDSEQAVDLLAQLRDHGVATCLVHDCRSSVPKSFAAGWQYAVSLEAEDGGSPSPDNLVEAVEKALRRLGKADRWLTWMNVGTLLPPWRVPEEYHERYADVGAEESDDEEPTVEKPEEVPPPLVDPVGGLIEAGDDETFLRLQGAYAAAVTYLDEGIGGVLELLGERGLLEEALLLVTSDRGYPLGEHGLVGEDRPWLHEERIHLPLLLRLPGGAEAGRRVPALTQPVDVLPTLLDAFQLPAADVHGRSLLPLAHGSEEVIRPYAVTGLRIGEAAEWGLRTPEWYYLHPGRAESGRGPRLYRKPEDRWEINDLRLHHLDLAEGFGHTVTDFVRAARQPGPLQLPPLPQPRPDVEPTAEDTEPHLAEGTRP